MRRLLAVTLLALVWAAGPAAARALDSAAHLALLEALPAARAAIQAEQRPRLDSGVTAQMQQAHAALVDFLGAVWLDLARVYPAGHFGPQGHAAWLDAYREARLAFHLAVNRLDDQPEGSLLGVVAGTRLVRDMDTLVADTATAQLGRLDPVAPLHWLQAWQAAAR